MHLTASIERVVTLARILSPTINFSRLRMQNAIAAETRTPHWSDSLSIDLKRSIAGGLAGATAKSMTAPLERVRIIRQAADRGTNTGRSLLLTIFRDEGVRGLWRGNAVNLARVIPSYAVRFSVFGHLSDYEARFSVLGNPFVAGSLSGLASALASYPLEVLRTRVSITGSLREAFRRGGLYAGCSLTVIETMPYAGLSLGTYNYLNQHYPVDSVWQRIGYGFAAGALATSVCFPIDTLRRNKIVRPSESIPAVAISLFEKGGIGRFYRGVSIAVLKAAPTVALTMLVNDLVLDGLS